MRKLTILFIILILPLSEFYRVPVAYCFQNASRAGLCRTTEHKACRHDSCGLNRAGAKTCRLQHSHHMHQSEGLACRAHIGCSHPDRSPLHSMLSDEDVYLPTKVELASYYSILSYNRNREITYEKEVAFPIERPPAL